MYPNKKQIDMRLRQLRLKLNALYEEVDTLNKYIISIEKEMKVLMELEDLEWVGTQYLVWNQKK